MATQYAQQSDLLTYSLNQAQLDSFDQGALDAALQAASAIADGHLTSQYQLPLAPNGWGADLVMYVCHVAAWLLWNKRGYNPEAPEDKVIREQYDAAMKYFRAIGEKNIHPAYVDSSSDSQGEEGPFVITAKSRGWRNSTTDVEDLENNATVDPYAGL